MNSLARFSIIALGFLFTIAQASAHAGHTHAPEDDRPTPAKTRIDEARKLVSANPDDASLYPPLALALASRARENGNGLHYDQAMEAIERSLELAPDNFPARKAEAWILLGRHEFAKALRKTRALALRSGDDAMVQAMLVDAAIETGNYEDAEIAAQWAIDLDPGGAPGLTRAAYLRELYGDFDGSIELMKLAANRIPPHEHEEQAWILTHIGHLHLLKNETDLAEKAQLAALDIFPDYHYALANLARVRTAKGDHAGALELQHKHYHAVPHTPNLYDLGLAQKRAGLSSEADKTFARFEKAAMAESTETDNSNRELIHYLIDIADKPSEALRIARLEMDARADYRGRHAFARALHANGEHAEAWQQMSKALELGVRYPEIDHHAGLIAAAAGDNEAARVHLHRSLAQAPAGPLAEDTRQALTALGD